MRLIAERYESNAKSIHEWIESELGLFVSVLRVFAGVSFHAIKCNETLNLWCKIQALRVRIFGW